METTFIDIVKKLVAEQGKETLLSQAKCKSFLADYTKGEYKKESRLLLQVLESGRQNAIMNTPDVESIGPKIIKQLVDDYIGPENAVAEIVDLLLLVLRGIQIKPIDSLEPINDEEYELVLNEDWELVEIQSPQAEQGITPEGYKWTAVNGGVIITGYTGSAKDLILPSSIEGVPVIRIDSLAFSKKRLTSVIIPNNVTSIGAWAFKDNNLSTVIIGNKVTSIEAEAFSYNALTSVIIPDSVTFIGCYAFSQKPAFLHGLFTGDYDYYLHKQADGNRYNALTSVTLPANVKLEFVHFKSIYLVKSESDPGWDSECFRENLDKYYNKHGMKAGLYRYSDKWLNRGWKWEAR